VETRRSRAVVGHQSRLVQEPVHAAVARDHAVLHSERLARRFRALVLGQHALAVVGMNDLDEELLVVGPLLHRVAEHRLELRARVDIRAGLVETVDVDDQRTLFDEGPKMGLAEQVMVDLSLMLLVGGASLGHCFLPRRS
jgi:hypothetical protein